MKDVKKYLLEHKRNKRIKFYEDEHRYEFFPDLRKSEGVKFEGITSWIGSFSKKKFKPKKVAKSCNNNPRSEYYQLGEETILQMWTDRRDHGSAIHKAVEDSVNLGVYDEEMSAYIDGFWRVMDEEGIEPFASEFVIYDEDIKRSTPIDVCGTRKGKLVLVDIKSFEKGMQFSPYNGETLKHPLGDLFDSKFERVSLQLSIEKKWLIDKYGLTKDDFGGMYVNVLNDYGSELFPVIDYHDDYVEKMYKYSTTPPWE